MILMNYVSSWMMALWTFQQGATQAANALVEGDGGRGGRGRAGVRRRVLETSRGFPFLRQRGVYVRRRVWPGWRVWRAWQEGRGPWVLVGVVAVCRRIDSLCGERGGRYGRDVGRDQRGRL